MNEGTYTREEGDKEANQQQEERPSIWRRRLSGREIEGERERERERY